VAASSKAQRRAPPGIDRKDEKAESLLRTAISTALQSPDLTRADRIRVVKVIKEEFDIMKQQLGLGAAPGALPTLNNVMSKAISIKQAMMEPEPTFKELFAQ
jgi:hypothetical protein